MRLANPAEEDRDKVFALKVLRKVEGVIFTLGAWIEFH